MQWRCSMQHRLLNSNGAFWTAMVLPAISASSGQGWRQPYKPMPPPSSARQSPDPGLAVPAGSASAAGTESQAPTTLLGRAQVAVVHAAAATSAAGTTLVNKVRLQALPALQRDCDSACPDAIYSRLGGFRLAAPCTMPQAVHAEMMQFGILLPGMTACCDMQALEAREMQNRCMPSV